MREVEAKFRVHPPFELPALVDERTGVAQVDAPVVQELNAVYFDTSDLRLAREGITLRYRTGEGAGDGWHLKLPLHDMSVPDSTTSARDELIESGDPEAIPERFGALVTAYVRSAKLGPVATLKTKRTSLTLRDSEGEPVAELVDDLVSVINNGHVAGRFRELEVEDKGGGEVALHRIGEHLRASGAVAGQFVPKVVRALGPEATSPPDPPPPNGVRPKQPARLALQTMLRSGVRNLMSRDPDVRRGADDAVHQMRVAARRLRSVLKTFQPLFDPTWAVSLQEELRWLGDSLGSARDNEVLLERLLGALDRLPTELVVGPVRARIQETIGGDLESGAATALATLDTDRYVALLDRLVDGAWEPMTLPTADVSAEETLRPLVRSAWDRLARRSARLRRPDATSEQWHSTRIAAKQVRYAAEAVAPVFGREARQLAGEVKKLQEVLGEHQDAVVAADALRRVATAPKAGSYAFTLGLLHAEQQRAIDRTRKQFREVWGDVSAAKHRKWLSG